MSQVKERMIHIIQEQPEDSNFYEILQELSFVNMVENGLRDSKSNKIVNEEHLKEEVKKW